MRNAELKRIWKFECGMWNRKELGSWNRKEFVSRNAECGIEKNAEFGMRNVELKRIGDLGLGILDLKKRKRSTTE